MNDIIYTRIEIIEGLFEKIGITDYNQVVKGLKITFNKYKFLIVIIFSVINDKRSYVDAKYFINNKTSKLKETD